MNRVKFATDLSGTDEYTLPYNPVDMEYDDGDYYTLKKSLASEAVKYKLIFDDRPIAMVWKGWDIDHPIFCAMLAELNTYVDEQKYVMWGDIQNFFSHSYTATGWNGPLRVVSVTGKLRGGGGKVYDEVRVILQGSE